MHNVMPNSGAYIYHLERHARKIGVVVQTSTAVRELVVQDGRVTGIRAERAGEPIEIRALGGVVLATGDFGGSLEMRATYISPDAALARPANPTNTGDGHRMVLALGGRIPNSHVYLGGARFDPPPASLIASLPPIRVLARFMAWALDNLPSWLLRPFVMSFLTTVLRSSSSLLTEGGLMINREGKRFTDELDAPTVDIPKQPGEYAYVLLDGRLVRQFSGPPHHVSTAPGVAYAYLPDYRRSRKDIYREAKTLAGLARKLGMAPNVLEQTVADFNGDVEARPASPSGKRHAFGEGPYVALGPVRSYITYTDSGVAVDEQHRVLGADDKPIPGLFAAGTIGIGGMLLEGQGHHLGWAFTSGRRAGRHAAFRSCESI